MHEQFFQSFPGLLGARGWSEPGAWGPSITEVADTHAKRTLDLVLCAVALPLVLVLLGICALVIRLESPGDVIVRQQRTGAGGRRFRMLRLRTCRKDCSEPPRGAADPDLLCHPRFNFTSDPEATRVGRFLQKTGLDELPQVFNVLLGDMSLVGPRPTSASADTYRLWHTARLQVRPGITGLGQISHRNELGFDDCSRLDIEYIRTRTLALDARILLRTVRLVLSSARTLIKRAIDIVLSAALLLILSPLMLAVAVAVRRTSPGPTLFRQVRVGRAGKPFRILKFRTMREDAEEVLAADPVLYATYVGNDYKLPPGQDPRITPIGRWLRKTSLDELPQLFNVLRGDMSLVGPRPIVPGEIVHYGLRAGKLCSVPPGLTGAWQVFGRSDLHYPERCDVELSYVKSWSLMQDVEILVRTVRVVIAGRGAA